MFYEIRRYHARPGRRDDWVRYMEDVVIPFQQSKGMDVTGSFIDEEDLDAYVWVRRFEDEAQRVSLYSAIYDSPRWTDEIAPVVADLLDRDKTVITRVAPTPVSALR